MRQQKTLRFYIFILLFALIYTIKRFGIIRGYEPSFKYWNDPDFFFDWTEGEFC